MPILQCGLLGLAMVTLICQVVAFTPIPPPTSPATGLANQIYTWRGQQIRYQCIEPASTTKSPNTPNDTPPCALLVHGLFVNADHWRKTLVGLSEQGYRAYAIDLLGCGYSSKPPRDSTEAQDLNGEKRFQSQTAAAGASVLNGVALGTANGGDRIADVDLRHPLNSCYNFYTWAEQLADFTRDIIQDDNTNTTPNQRQQTTLVCNSIGTISALQAAIDRPDYYNGVFVVNPNFRELHVAEIPFPSISMPLIRSVQQLLRDKGQPLFDALAKPTTVKQILMEPYAITTAVDDELVDVLLTPLLTEGAADVVFDTLSYSAGPLPEQQLSSQTFPESVPVWVCYGEKDPWTPPQRVERLGRLERVEKVVLLPGVGHCPHDEAPELVNPLLLDFMERVKERKVVENAI